MNKYNLQTIDDFNIHRVENGWGEITTDDVIIIL